MKSYFASQPWKTSSLNGILLSFQQNLFREEKKNRSNVSQKISQLVHTFNVDTDYLNLDSSTIPY